MTREVGRLSTAADRGEVACDAEREGVDDIEVRIEPPALSRARASRCSRSSDVCECAIPAPIVASLWGPIAVGLARMPVYRIVLDLDAPSVVPVGEDGMAMLVKPP